MSKTKLRPCPFCGEAKDVSVESLQPSWWVHCASCGGAGPMRELGALAEKAWNRRAGPEIELSPDIRSAASEPDWEIERLNKKIMLEQAARIRLLAELLEVFKTNKPAEAVRLARKMIEEEMR